MPPCPSNSSEGDVRDLRDCYPWPGASQSVCEARGCVWCLSDISDVPPCLYNDDVCPSRIPESSRVNCLPEGGVRQNCLQKRCIWCESASIGVPSCFYDDSVSLGGELCVAEIPYAERIDCHPDATPTKPHCLARGCFWCDSTPSDGTPKCFRPRQQGYRLVGDVVETSVGFKATLEHINTPSWFGSDIKNVLLEVELQTADRLRIKFSDPASARYQVPLNITSSSTRPTNTQYEITFDNNSTFTFAIKRKETQAVIFDTSVGGLIISDQFLQIATKLDSSNVYGFGEHEHASLRHDMNWRTWVMYTMGQTVKESNLYGVQPFYINLEKSGKAHGVLFLNSNAQDVLLSPAPAITYRTNGGILDIYVFFGPTPDNVVEQYSEAVGRPLMVPYWSLGFQLSRYGYNNLGNLTAAVDRMRQYDIPHDIQYADIDYMDAYKDFTIDANNYGGLPEYVQQLKEQGTNFIIIVDPAIYRLSSPGEYPTFDRANDYDVWVNMPNGLPAAGRVWPGETYFPDYSKHSTQTWWTQECVAFHETLNYDGLWIDMNEPSNFATGYLEQGCENNPINNPPYTSPSLRGQRLYAFTLCPDAVQEFGIHYNVHNLYGWSMAQQTLPAARAATGKRSIVLSRSTFPGSSKNAQHWLGDNNSAWADLRNSLIGIMEFNMFGYPYVGPDICGFFGRATEELCLRWQQTGAFYTFSRNHNGNNFPDQDPGIWPEVARVTRDTLHIRYTLLPFLYMLFHKAHIFGTPVIRPLFFQFPRDINTLNIGSQFMWGSGLLISPALDQNQTKVRAYFPNARWFSYYDGFESRVRGAFTELDAPFDFIPLHILGGNILPTQQPANSTAWSRTLPMGLIVALDDDLTAAGSLFWDDGDTIDTYAKGVYLFVEYRASSNELSSMIVSNGYSAADNLRLDDVRVMGTRTFVSSVRVNGEEISTWTQDLITRQLTLTNLNLLVRNSFSITWF